jgi:hypothetical protein
MEDQICKRTVRIRIRIDPPHPLVLYMRWLNGAVLWMRPEKPREASCHRRCDTIKIPPCSKTLSTDHRLQFCSTSLAIVTSQYKWKILERDVKQWITNQSINLTKPVLNRGTPNNLHSSFTRPTAYEFIFIYFVVYITSSGASFNCLETSPRSSVRSVWDISTVGRNRSYDTDDMGF